MTLNQWKNWIVSVEALFGDYFRKHIVLIHRMNKIWENGHGTKIFDNELDEGVYGYENAQKMLWHLLKILGENMTITDETTTHDINRQILQGIFMDVWYFNYPTPRLKLFGMVRREQGVKFTGSEAFRRLECRKFLDKIHEMLTANTLFTDLQLQFLNNIIDQNGILNGYFVTAFQFRKIPIAANNNITLPVFELRDWTRLHPSLNVKAIRIRMRVKSEQYSMLVSEFLKRSYCGCHTRTNLTQRWYPVSYDTAIQAHITRLNPLIQSLEDLLALFTVKFMVINGFENNRAHSQAVVGYYICCIQNPGNPAAPYGVIKGLYLGKNSQHGRIYSEIVDYLTKTFWKRSITYYVTIPQFDNVYNALGGQIGFPMRMAYLAIHHIPTTIWVVKIRLTGKYYYNNTTAEERLIRSLRRQISVPPHNNNFSVLNINF
eukprot:330950_1